MNALRDLAGSYRALTCFWIDVRPHRHALAGSGLLLMAITLLELAKPWPLQWVIDHALVPEAGESRSFAFVAWSGGAALLAIALLSSSLQYAQSLLVARTNHQVTRGLRARVFAHLTKLGPRFHGSHRQGDLLVRVMGDVPMVSAVLTESSMELLARVLLIVGAALTLLAIDPLLALIVAACAPVLAWLTALFTRRLREAVEKNRRKEGHLADYLGEVLGATALLQSYGREQDAAERASEMSRKSARTGLKAARLSARLSFSVELLLSTAMAAALVAGAYRVAQGDLRTGELLVFLAYVRGLLKPVRSASKHSDRMAKGMACAGRVNEVLSAVPEIQNAPDAVRPPARIEVLRFEGVHYEYPDGTSGLRGFDVELRRGELVAIAGASGAGKSTAAMLCVRLMDPTRGRLSVDGIDLRRLELGSLRERIAVCSQESLLLGATLRENLLLGRPDASEADLWLALERANAAAVVRALPGALDEELGGGGNGLSGGEKRRIALARALLRGAQVLVLDEPFAGLDRPSVERLCSTLREEARARIVLVIAHDLGSLDLFDRVLLVEAGAIVDEGTHADLSERSESYRRVVRNAVATAGDPA
jgi:ATP-binding cassette, subfamily B, bacterial